MPPGIEKDERALTASNGKRPPEERIASLAALLAKLDAHAAKLAVERARVAAELAKLLSKLPAAAAGEQQPVAAQPAPAQPAAGTGRAKTEAARQKDARGRCAAMCIEEIEAVASLWSSAVACVALGRSCALLLYDNGQPPRFTRDFPTQCEQLAEQLGQRTAAMAPALFVSIGSEERFYVRYADGKQQWVASAECTADIRAKPVAQVSFGREYDDYLVLYRDGSVKWHGVPPKLSAKLKGLTHSSPAIANVSMGPDGEWFISFQDGTWEMGGCSDALADKVAEVLNGGNAIKLITFGGNDSWLIRYNKPAVSKAKAKDGTERQ